jgi:hypothetical protein
MRQRGAKLVPTEDGPWHYSLVSLGLWKIEIHFRAGAARFRVSCCRNSDLPASHFVPTLGDRWPTP